MIIYKFKPECLLPRLIRNPDILHLVVLGLSHLPACRLLYDASLSVDNCDITFDVSCNDVSSLVDRSSTAEFRCKDTEHVLYEC